MGSGQSRIPVFVEHGEGKIKERSQVEVPRMGEPSVRQDQVRADRQLPSVQRSSIQGFVQGLRPHGGVQDKI